MVGLVFRSPVIGCHEQQLIERLLTAFEVERLIAVSDDSGEVPDLAFEVVLRSLQRIADVRSDFDVLVERGELLLDERSEVVEFVGRGDDSHGVM